MLKEKLIDKFSAGDDLIGIHPARCLRMRFNKNRCSKCIDCCPAGAIRIEGGFLDIDKKTCTECMLCAAACPSGGLEINSFNFYSVLSRLRKVPRMPVLACNMREDIKAHVNTFCMGYLSEEHLMALLVFLEAPLQLDLIGCKSCKNSFIIDVLKKRLESVNRNLSREMPGKIILIEDETKLQFQAVPYDRRGFFGAIKKLTMEGAATLLESAADREQTASYGDKVLPLKRRLLNSAVSLMIEQKASSREDGGDEAVLLREILKNYYYNLVLDDNCNKCFACVGMCPTGALKEQDVSDDGPGDIAPRQLLFDASFCNGCGLCSDFCAQSSISIMRGFSVYSPLEERRVKKEKLDEQ